jgi:hypothetical protein
MNETILFFSSAIMSSILFYVLVEGFNWKPARAGFAAPFAVVIVPVSIVIILFWGLSKMLYDGLNLFLNPRRTRKA